MPDPWHTHRLTARGEVLKGCCRDVQLSYFVSSLIENTASSLTRNLALVADAEKIAMRCKAVLLRPPGFSAHIACPQERPVIPHPHHRVLLRGTSGLSSEPVPRPFTLLRMVLPWFSFDMIKTNYDLRMAVSDFVPGSAFYWRLRH